MKLLWWSLFFFSLICCSLSMPVFSLSAELSDVSQPVIHHRHKKHHVHHRKHRRRSLSSKEDTKARRNKQVMLTKPYWPWP